MDNELRREICNITSELRDDNLPIDVTDKEVEYELKESYIFLTKEWGKTLSYAYPYGAYNAFIKSCVSKYYKYAFSVNQGGTSLVADSLQIRRYSITEIYDMLSLTIDEQ